MARVYHLTPRWSENLFGGDPGHVAVIRPHPDGDLDGTLAIQVEGKPNRIPITFRATTGAPRMSPVPGASVWGLRKLGPGVWNVEPSIDYPGPPLPVHAFVTICGVPEPAPWER